MTEGESVIFGDRGFGFESSDIAEVKKLVVENARVQAEMLIDEDERVRRVAERDRGKSEAETAFFEAHDDETILGGLRYIFDRGRELEAAGIHALDLAAAMRDEMPDLSAFGGVLLERQAWGYHLNQMIFAESISREQ